MEQPPLSQFDDAKMARFCSFRLHHCFGDRSCVFGGRGLGVYCHSKIVSCEQAHLLVKRKKRRAKRSGRKESGEEAHRLCSSLLDFALMLQREPARKLTNISRVLIFYLFDSKLGRPSKKTFCQRSKGVLKATMAFCFIANYCRH